MRLVVVWVVCVAASGCFKVNDLSKIKGFSLRDGGGPSHTVDGGAAGSAGSQRADGGRAGASGGSGNTSGTGGASGVGSSNAGAGAGAGATSGNGGGGTSGTGATSGAGGVGGTGGMGGAAGTSVCMGAGCPTCADRSRETLFVGAKRASGNCSGDCNYTLKLPASNDCDAAMLDICDASDSNCTRHNMGTLTPTGHERTRTLAAKLVGTMLMTKYGCPGCADSPTMTLDLRRNVQQTSHQYDVGSAPPPLVDADAFMSGIIDALTTCVSNANVVPNGACKAK